VTRTSSLNAIAVSLAESLMQQALRREAPASERSDRSAPAVPPDRRSPVKARAARGRAAATPRLRRRAA
jgi:hypothetical protein